MYKRGKRQKYSFFHFERVYFDAFCILLLHFGSASKFEQVGDSVDGPACVALSVSGVGTSWKDSDQRRFRRLNELKFLVVTPPKKFYLFPKRRRSHVPTP